MKVSFKILCVFLLSLGLFAFSLSAKSHSASSAPTNYLNIAELKITQVIPPPPADGMRDEVTREAAMASCNRKKVKNDVIWDDVFSYNNVLGSQFNAQRLPLTAALFQQVDSDTRLAIRAAKHTFERKRPQKNKGYTYPSGRSTDAFVMAYLLSDLFPQERSKLLDEAKKKAWSRVQLGNHYPSDDYAGEIYGKYLAQEFLANAAFQQKWNAVRDEITKINSRKRTQGAQRRNYEG